MLFTSRKTVLKSWLDTSSIPCYLLNFSSIFLKCNLDTSSILGGSIEKASASSIPPRHLLDRSRKLLHPRYLLDTCWIDRASVLNLTPCCSIASSIPQLLKTRSSIPTSTDTLIPFDTFICRDLLAAYIRPLWDPNFISLRSFSRYFFVSLPKLSHLTPNLFLKDSSSFFKFLLTW